MKMSAKPPKATANSKLLLSKQRIADWAEEVRFKDRVDFVFFTGRGPTPFIGHQLMVGSTKNVFGATLVRS